MSESPWLPLEDLTDLPQGKRCLISDGSFISMAVR